MTRADDHQQYVPRPLPADYIAEHRANFRWLSALRAALSRGLTDAEAAEEAKDAVPEALEPSRYPDGKPGGDNPIPAPPKPGSRPTQLRRDEPSDGVQAMSLFTQQVAT